MSDQINLFTFSGVVEQNLGRGKELGYPTANIFVKKDIPEGIFLGYAVFGQRRLPSLVFVGSPITFGELDRKGEVYILDFDEDIYGQNIKVECIHKIRDNMRFDTQEELVDKMNEDENKARAFFKLTKVDH